jgi:SAM-dependent methyltransferase
MDPRTDHQLHPAMDHEEITFSFGKNWRDFVDSVDENAVQRAMKDIEDWLDGNVKGCTVLDIGSGSGIHSLCYYLLGAESITSLDVDPYSVDSTRLLWRRQGSPSQWKIFEGSILDKPFTQQLGLYDIVYSWGVLHHTGSMWEALDNACSLVKEGGKLWIALYVKGPTYAKHLELKRAYNRASTLGKKRMQWTEILRVMRDRRKAGLNPLKWNEKYDRGMDVYHDIIDWLGGLPYEVASKEEVIGYCEARHFVLERCTDLGEMSNNIYLFRHGA